MGTLKDLSAAFAHLHLSTAGRLSIADVAVLMAAGNLRERGLESVSVLNVTAMLPLPFGTVNAAFQDLSGRGDPRPERPNLLSLEAFDPERYAITAEGERILALFAAPAAVAA